MLAPLALPLLVGSKGAPQLSSPLTGRVAYTVWHRLELGTVFFCRTNAAA